MAARAAAEFVDELTSVATELQRTGRALSHEHRKEWIAALARQCEAARDELARLAFWLGEDRGAKLIGGLSALSASELEWTSRTVDRDSGRRGNPSCGTLAAQLLMLIERADRDCSLRRLPEWTAETVRCANRLLEVCPDRPDVWSLPRWSAGRIEASAAARQQLSQIDSLAELCRDFSEMDFRFLYDPERKLLAVGYNVAEQRRDASCYDLLASECRLASFLAISDGQLPVDHWTALGRAVALHGGVPTLMSWSGSMFEYLMPMLIMPSYPATLLDSSCRSAVRRQMEYARQKELLWGISESCYDRRNDDGAYSYRAFGVPGLRLERRTDHSLVVAPYASALAAMVAPRAACENLSRLEELGAGCSYGFYDAVDCTAPAQFLAAR